MTSITATSTTTCAQQKQSHGSSLPGFRPDLDLATQKQLVAAAKESRRATQLYEWKTECTVACSRLNLKEKAFAHKLLIAEAKRHQIANRRNKTFASQKTGGIVHKELERFDLLQDKTRFPRLLQDVDVLMTLPDDTIPRATPWNCPELLQRNYSHTRKELLRLNLWA